MLSNTFPRQEFPVNTRHVLQHRLYFRKTATPHPCNFLLLQKKIISLENKDPVKDIVTRYHHIQISYMQQLASEELGIHASVENHCQKVLATNKI